MQLDFLEAAISHFFVVHVEDLDKFEGHEAFGLKFLGFEDVGEFSLTDELHDFEAIYNPAYEILNLKTRSGRHFKLILALID